LLIPCSGSTSTNSSFWIDRDFDCCFTCRKPIYAFGLFELQDCFKLCKLFGAEYAPRRINRQKVFDVMSKRLLIERLSVRASGGQMNDKRKDQYPP
jgi:hypothetical protein